MKRLAKLMGNPQDSFKSIHLAGTNGKGSIALKASLGLRHAGVKTALYTSPHIEHFGERMLVNG